MLIAAHGNSLRALVKYLDEMSDADIMALNIPTGLNASSAASAYLLTCCLFLATVFLGKVKNGTVTDYKLEGHSVERTYLQQSCSHGSR